MKTKLSNDGYKIIKKDFDTKSIKDIKDELTVKTPADLKGVNLRMPGTDAWQFLGKALGASPTPLAFNEVYTALQTGAVDGQDNPLPTVVDKKFYEVTKQIILTSHLVDLNYIAFSNKTWDKLSGDQKLKVQQAADAAASSVESELEARVQQWAKRSSHRGHGVRNHGLRTLLATLPSIWPAAEHADPLFSNGAALASCEAGQVRKCYLKAVRLVHPDKIQGAQDVDGEDLVRKRVLAQKLFAVLSEAWTKFQKE